MAADSIYNVGLIGTRKVEVVAAPDPKTACLLVGWAPEWCRVVNITHAVKKLEENGELEAA